MLTKAVYLIINTIKSDIVKLLQYKTIFNQNIL